MFLKTLLFFVLNFIFDPVLEIFSVPAICMKHDRLMFELSDPYQRVYYY